MESTDIKSGENHKGKLTGVFLAGFVFGAAFVWFFAGEEVLSPTLSDTELADATTDTVQTDENTGLAIGALKGSEISVPDQLAGDRVFIDALTMGATGWVVVHESLPNGDVGNALGARRYIEGTYTDASVGLLRNTEVGKIYHVVFYNDVGTEEFTLGEDTPVLDGEGKLQKITFRAIRIDRKI